jgi:hypothetical protein
MKNLDFSMLVGLTLKSVTGCNRGSNAVRLETNDGRAFQLYHSQDCCESVLLEDVNGDPLDLVGHPILMAECVTKPGGEPNPEHSDSWTWTFYKMATVKGTVVMRWLGESNGYYGEEVDFREAWAEEDQ